MNDKHDKTWRELAKYVRKGERHIISGAPADRLLEELPDEQLTEDELEAIMRAVVSGGELDLGRARSEEAADGTVTPETSAVEEDVLQLNRNKGEKDDAAESLAEKLRREALEEDEDEES